jgi:hypothetical protein
LRWGRRPSWVHQRDPRIWRGTAKPPELPEANRRDLPAPRPLPDGVGADLQDGGRIIRVKQRISDSRVDVARPFTGASEPICDIEIVHR